MNVYLKYLFILFFVLGLSSIILSQEVNLNREDIEIRYIKDKVEVAPGKSFFNILAIKNNSDQEQSFNIQFNTPKNWEVIGSSFEKITLPPMGDINIPVRVAVAKDAKGGVGYVVVAVLTDLTGSVLDTEYSFLNIPAKSVINIKTSKKSKYIDHKSLSSDFSVKIKNSGNIDEIININLIADKSLYFVKNNENLLIEDIHVPMNSEKLITYEVKLQKDIDYKKYKYHSVKLTFNLHDSIVNKTVWFNYLDWKFDNIYVNTVKPLNIELAAYDILGEGKPSFKAHLFGKILLKNKRDIYYSFQNRNSSNSTNNVWVNSYIDVNYNSLKTNIVFGDIHRNFHDINTGRGISFLQKINNKNIVKGLYTKNLQSSINNIGASYILNLKNATMMEIGGFSSDYQLLEMNSYLGYTKFSTKILKQSVSILYGQSTSDYHSIDRNYQLTGWSYNINLSGNIKNFMYNIDSRYGTPNYSGKLNGRMYTTANSSIIFSKRSNLHFRYSNTKYKPAYFINNENFSNRFTNYQNLAVIQNQRISNKANLFISSVFDKQSSNSFSSINQATPFTSYTAQGKVGLRYSEPYSRNSFSVSGKYGVTNIYNYPTEINELPVYINPDKIFFNVGEFRLNVMRKHFSFYFIYHYGPYNISQQFSYFYLTQFQKSINIIPVYERYFFNNKIKFTTRGTIISNIVSKNNRVNLNSYINWFAGKGWEFKLLNSTSFQQTKYGNNSSMYSSTYFELTIRKSFDFNQPRIKFYNYKAVYYKDLNGNRIHDANEPGVSQVLSDIKRSNPQADIEDPNYNGEFYTNNLISNPEGYIEYNNIPEGDYFMKYSPQNLNIGTFETEYVEKRFTINKDTVMHIPFIERNKLFGKITLNRTKHSALGEIPINNIKIVVEGNEKTYSTLTDKEGNFELYIPVADYYKVRVTNIFREHFNLRQEYYIVKFNGYKQFELSFDFDEKDRKIAFDESDFLIDDDDLADDDFSFDDIKVIKQTNLRGIVKDANSLIPIHATVSIHNINTHDLISETASSKRTGVYFTSFFAGNDYNIKATSKGYWTYKANLNIQQVTTFENITHDILLKKIIINEEIKTDNLHFKSYKAELSPLAMAELDNMLSTLFLNPSIHIEISGHSDNIEALTVNPIELSNARATSVASYLVKHGLSEKRIIIKSMGNSSPVTQDDSNSGRARNRRVEIRVAAY